MVTAEKKEHIYCHITKAPGVCGGQACIDGTRVRVKNIVFLHKQGHSPGEIVDVYPFLSLAQVYAALSYYHDFPAEIDASLANDEAWAETLRGSSSQ
jgi:uncharacterized protein (DUF433 family)